jgi:hypothetical protein
MNKKSFFLKGIILIIAFISGFKISANTYYVSNTGNDGVNGTSAGSAWATISKVNSSTISAGDSVLFQAGGLWRDELQVVQGVSGAGNGIYYGRYGAGENPKIYGSSKAITFTSTGTANVWQSATSVSNPYDGDWGFPGNTFFVTNDSATWGMHEEYTAGFANLNNEFEWTWNNNTLYVYAPGDPDTWYDDVEVVQRDLCIGFLNDASSYIEINGIDFRYSRRAGYGNMNYPEEPGQTDVTFRNCNIGYIGIKSGAAAYGIEAFHSNFLVENCYFSDCGRRAISFNFYESHSPAMEIQNIIIRNNIFKRGQHTTSLDLAWIDEEAANVKDVYFYNNIIDDSEIAWRTNDAGSNQLYIEANGDNIINLNIINNVFIESTARNILVSGGHGVKVWNNTIYGSNTNIDISPFGNVSFRNSDVDGLLDIDYRNNILVNNLIPANLDCHGILVDYSTAEFSHLDFNLYWQTQVITDRNILGGWFGYYNINEWNTYKEALSPWDAHSPVPADPLFVNQGSKNFHLTENSHAKGTGTVLPYVIAIDAYGLADTINKYDIEGTQKSTTSPSIGAYEYPVFDNSQAEIVFFNIPNQEGSAVDAANNTVVVIMPYGTDVTSLVPDIILSDYATINPLSGVSQDFKTPKNYTVISGNGLNTQEYTVSVVFGDLCNTVNINIDAVVTPDTNDLGNGTIRLTPGGGTSPYSYSCNNNETSSFITDLKSGVYSVVVKDKNLCTQTGIYKVGQFDTRIIDSILISPTLDWLNCPAPWIEILTSDVTYYAGSVGIRGVFANFNNYGEPPVGNYPDAVVQGYGNSENNDAFIYLTNLSGQYNYDIEVLSNRNLAEVRNQITEVNGVSKLIDVGDRQNCIAYFDDIPPVTGAITISTSPVTSIYSYINAVKVYIKTKEIPLNSAANITGFSIPDQISSSINADSYTVDVLLPYGSDVTSLTPLITVSQSATIEPASGVARNFLNPQIYKVTAQNGTELNWTIKVSVAGPVSVKNNLLQDEPLLYPNPASDQVYLKTNRNSRIIVRDFSGKIIFKQSTIGGISKLNFTFQTGVYFIQIINNDEQTITKKLIVR